MYDDHHGREGSGNSSSTQLVPVRFQAAWDYALSERVTGYAGQGG